MILVRLGEGCHNRPWHARRHSHRGHRDKQQGPGRWIGQTATGQDHGFEWENGVITDLGMLGGASSKAFAINERGQVVGESQTANGGLRAVLWTNQ